MSIGSRAHYGGKPFEIILRAWRLFPVFFMSLLRAVPEPLRVPQRWQSPPVNSEDTEDENNSGSLDSLLLEQKSHLSLGYLQLFALTCGIGGLQVTWSVILAQGAPLLVSLGLSKPCTALVWIAGPLCGTFLQPLVGHFSDRSRCSWGQRRPFIVVGAMSTVFSIMMLGWVKEITNWLEQLWGAEISRQDEVSQAVIVSAVFWIYALNISIQPLQIGLRALVAENCPSHQQSSASAWASRMTGVGNIFGYLVGFAPLPNAIQILCKTRFQGLCIIASLALTATIPITCCFIHEKAPGTMLLASPPGLGVIQMAKRLVRTYKTMPAEIRQICRIQFLSWMGWFPLLFYATSYVGELYSTPRFSRDNSILKLPQSSNQTTGTRIGTFATFLSAIVAFTASIILPFFVNPPAKCSAHSKSSIGRQRIWKFGISISKFWMLSHLFFALVTFSTLFIHTHRGGTVLIALTGISWAMTMWAPYAFIGAELAAIRERNLEHEIDMEELDPIQESQAGLVLSLHNMAISAPQIPAALICSIIFWVFRAAGSEDGVAWALRAGGLGGLGAAWASLGLEET